MIVITDERCTGYHSPGHPERPARISRSLDALRKSDLPVEWRSPSAVARESLLRAHSAEHLHHVEEAVYDFDADTPAHPGILAHAERSVGGAIDAMTAALRGEIAFSLLRPPGHHATRSRAMGFCYLNSIAIAALEAIARGVSRVAILDFDVHHGNGTEEIIAGHAGIRFASIHQHPCYPGTGTDDVGDNCFNHPVPPGLDRKEYRKVIEAALERLLSGKPALLGVSAGFDAYARDPIAQETLEAEDFHWIGERIRAAGVPAFSVLEGGYSDDLPGLILAYLRGLLGR